MSHKVIKPSEVKVGEFHRLLLSLVAPRPIAFVSTVNTEGIPNLSPYSFFNCFGANPPVLIFSPARRVRDNNLKHTLANAQAVGECVVNMLDYAMVQQASLASCEYAEGVNEFTKAGFTELSSDLVRVPRVKESPASFECKVLQVIETGQQGGAGNLVICEIVAAHVRQDLLNSDGTVNLLALDLVGRMGGDSYVRASGQAIFDVAKPNLNIGMGIDALPEHIRNSEVLTGNDLAQLANFSTIPSVDERSIALNQIQIKYGGTHVSHEKAKELIAEGQLVAAWAILLRE